MTQVLLPKTVRSLHVVGENGTQEIYRRKQKKKRKDSRMMKPLRKVSRGLLGAERDGLDRLVARFDRSNRKKKDGWVTDLFPNLLRSGTKSEKKASKVIRL